MTGASDGAQRQRLQAILRADATLMRLLVHLRALRLPQWRLVAGCLYQTVWNVLTDRAQGTGIQDYDLIYFDAHDLSWEAEDAVIRRVAAATIDCVGPVQVRNQARVHLWFHDRFGISYPPLSCADEALLRYASVVHAVGVRLTDDDGLDVIAPFGLHDLFAMVIRPNRRLDNAVSHARKAARAQVLWPEVTVISWNDQAEPADPDRA
ncbi:MAG TPA: nucleotidyltransferase family protein [Acetobacteraceae bacterium]